MKQILLIEDNPDLAFGLKNNLELEGYQVSIEKDGRAGLQQVRRNPPDLVILDLMLPEMDGFHVLKAIRADETPVPVLILTARGEEMDKVTGLRLGADDYVTKPFGLLELLARVEALLRRAVHEEEPSDTPVVFGAVEVSPATRTVRHQGQPVELSPKEFDLLMALLRRKGAIASRGDLLTEVWGYADDVLSRTVDTHIGELRRKLEDDPGAPRHILTVRKAGYRLEP